MSGLPFKFSRPRKLTFEPKEQAMNLSNSNDWELRRGIDTSLRQFKPFVPAEEPQCCATCKHCFKESNPVVKCSKPHVCKAQVRTDWSDGNFYFLRVKHDDCCELYDRNTINL